MEDDLDLALLISLREMTTTLVETCTDAGLLDLICKLLIRV
jgi:hypothetical protein